MKTQFTITVVTEDDDLLAIALENHLDKALEEFEGVNDWTIQSA